MPELLENEIRGLGLGDPTGAILDMLEATGASDLAILEALEFVTAEMEASGFDGYITIGRVPAPGTDKTYPITFDADRFRNDLAAAAHKRLVS